MTPLALAVALACRAGTDPALSDRPILFVSQRHPDGVYVMTRDGRGQRMIYASHPFLPRWSPDGRSIALFEPDSTGWRIVVMGAGGEHPTVVQRGIGVGAGLAWSSDGSRFAYVTTDGSATWIEIAGIDGSPPVRVQNTDDARLDRVDWSPDGRWIAFMAPDPGSAGRSVFVIAPDGAGRRQVTSGAFDFYPAWSPDGRQIAFSRCITNGPCNVMVTAADGSGVPWLVVHDGTQPRWSPDGMQLVYANTSSQPFDVYVVDLDGRNIRNLSRNAALDAEPDWRPTP